MRAYVQQVKQEESIYLAMIQAAHWFWQRGYEVIRFEFDDIGQGRLDADLFDAPDEMIVRGGVETIRQVLLRAGRPLPPSLDLPRSLSQWIGRRVWHTTMGEVRAMVDSKEFEPLHIKPLVQQKLFSGGIIRAFRDLIPTASVGDDIPVLAQGYVDFISEWRVSVLRRKIWNVGHYRGNPLLFPNVDTLRAALNAFDDCPIGFGMDWGVTSSGQTLLVEVNDGYSLGNYGLRGPEYTALIEARWRQLMGLSDNGIGEFTK